MDFPHDFRPTVAEVEQGQIKLFSLVLRKGLHLRLHRVLSGGVGGCLGGGLSHTGASRRAVGM